MAAVLCHCHLTYLDRPRVHRKPQLSPRNFSSGTVDAQRIEDRKEQRKYREAFGPFYRIENHILSSTPLTPSNHTSVNHLPSIVTTRNLKLAFRMQELVDQIEGACPYQSRHPSMQLLS